MAVPEKKAAKTLIFVTGLSGAGKSTSLAAFADIGYHTIDNLPLGMVMDLLEQDTLNDQIAIGLDSRSLSFSPELFIETVQKVRAAEGVKAQVLLIEATDESLLRRFSENRRRHPLTPVTQKAEQAEGPVALLDAISMERRLVHGIRQIVDAVVDTSDQSTKDTRRLIRDRYCRADTRQMGISVVSFGYSLGLPNDADMVFDVRFLRNPHYVPDLRPLTGLVSDVANYVRADVNYLPFIRHVEDTLGFLLPLYDREGKSYFTLAFGCTGGKHRSVAVAEHVGSLIKALGYQPTLSHRNAPSPLNRRLGDTG